MKVLLIAVLSSGALLCAGLAARDYMAEPPRLLRLQDVIDLGTIPPGRQIIEGRLTLTNDRNEPLEITGLDAGCGCMTGWDGDAVIPAHGSSTYTLRFDRNMLPAGDVSRQVMVRTNKDATDLPLTTFRMNIPRPTEEPRLMVWPSVIDIGRTRAADNMTGIDQIIQAFVPFALSQEKTRPRITLALPDWLTLERLNDGDAASRNGVDGAIVRYRVSSSGPLPTGKFDAELLFTLPAGDPEVIPERHAVVIRGEVVSDTTVMSVVPANHPGG